MGKPYLKLDLEGMKNKEIVIRFPKKYSKVQEGIRIGENKGSGHLGVDLDKILNDGFDYAIGMDKPPSGCSIATFGSENESLEITISDR